ncbi:MAG: DUF3047 domain-containing protein [Proteobacteria bacterium]|nr:DUF3047 domain-containing protein [Pseudomonadota bacterium]
MPVRSLAACVTVLVLAAGCAGTPDDPLLASSAVVASEPRQSDAVIEVARFSSRTVGAALPAHWQPWIVLPSKRRTEYRLVATAAGVVLEAQARAAASGLYRVLRVDPRRHSALEWRWRIPERVAGADPRRASREDAPARLIVSFHGDIKKLDFGDRMQMRLAKALSGRALPYATLMYVWSDTVAEETVVHNPHTDRIRMIVVRGEGNDVKGWTTVRRNVLADYRKAFDEDPWDMVAIGVMTDTDNTGRTASAWYGDITLRSLP